MIDEQQLIGYLTQPRSLADIATRFEASSEPARAQLAGQLSDLTTAGRLRSFRDSATGQLDYQRTITYARSITFVDSTPASHAGRLGETERRVRLLREALRAQLLGQPFAQSLPHSMTEEPIGVLLEYLALAADPAQAIETPDPSCDLVLRPTEFTSRPDLQIDAWLRQTRAIGPSDKHRIRLERGLFVSKPPFFYKTLVDVGDCEDYYEIDPAWEPVVRDLLQRQSRLPDRFSAAARDLEARGVQRPGQAAWSESTVREIIRQPALAGYQRHGEAMTHRGGSSTSRRNAVQLYPVGRLYAPFLTLAEWLRLSGHHTLELDINFPWPFRTAADAEAWEMRYDLVVATHGQGHSRRQVCRPMSAVTARRHDEQLAAAARRLQNERGEHADQ